MQASPQRGSAPGLTTSVVSHFNGRTYGPVANAAEAAGPVVSNNGRCRSSYGSMRCARC